METPADPAGAATVTDEPSADEFVGVAAVEDVELDGVVVAAALPVLAVEAVPEPMLSSAVNTFSF